MKIQEAGGEGKHTGGSFTDGVCIGSGRGAFAGMGTDPVRKSSVTEQLTGRHGRGEADIRDHSIGKDA